MAKSEQTAPESPVDPAEQISRWRKLAYGTGDLYGGGAFSLINLFYLIFLTDVAHLSPAWAALIMFVAKIWDALTDPLMGYLSDRTRSRLGRRRIYFLVGIVPVGLSFWLLWVWPQGWSSGALFAYFLTVSLLFRSVFTMVMVPYSALIPEMTRDYRERASLSGYRMLCSTLSTLLVATLPSLVIAHSHSPAAGYATMGALFGIYFALPWIAVFFSSFERPQWGNRQPLHFFEGYGVALQNRSFLLLIGLYLCGYLAVDVNSSVMLYFARYVMGIPAGLPSSLLLGAATIMQVIALPAYIYIARQRGKRTAFLLGAAIWLALAPLLLLFHAGSSRLLLYLLAAGIGIGMAGVVYAPWAMLPDVIEVDELVTGRRREGIFAGMMTFLRKISGALAVSAIGWTLAATHYVPNHPQPPSALLSIRLLMGVAPVLLLALAFFFASKYPITAKRHAQLLEMVQGEQTVTPAGLALVRQMAGPSGVTAVVQRAGA